MSKTLILNHKPEFCDDCISFSSGLLGINLRSWHPSLDLENLPWLCLHALLHRTSAFWNIGHGDDHNLCVSLLLCSIWKWIWSAKRRESQLCSHLSQQRGSLWHQIPSKRMFMTLSTFKQGLKFHWWQNFKNKRCHQNSTGLNQVVKGMQGALDHHHQTKKHIRQNNLLV